MPDAENYLDDEKTCDKSACLLSSHVRLKIPQALICGSEQHRWMEGLSDSYVPTSPLTVDV